ncbi:MULTISPECIES: hypothetical protein [unclassified Rhodococcus (in: high G+C Gram-positive bacteria)]|uniref:hypothetical protein n=1 Tax=unclassified Rhodococcus (in: high G+C Gram-positive bacteria) TaxID=192944 RepID=UPI00114021E4|nr:MULTISPECIES: hypothetical protein [unclassified Rhodococcus (in: high G+C Gram-positive bacteria)]
MPNFQPPLRRVVGDFTPESFGDPMAELVPFRQCRTASDARALLHEHIAAEVPVILELVVEADAFDVIELMRMREFPIAPDPRLAPRDGASLPVEILAAVLLARASRKPNPTPRQNTRPNEVIEELHHRCARLGRIASYRQLTEGMLTGDPFARLASEYQGAVLNIRNLQYDHIRDEHDRKLFETSASSELMQTHLGYGYLDVLAVRSAMKVISANRMTRLRDDTGNLLMAHQHETPEDIPHEVIEEFMSGMIPFMFLPAERSVIASNDVAEESGLDVVKVTQILQSFAQQFDDSVSPVRRVFDLLMGSNPFLLRPLMSDGGHNFALTSNDIGLDSLRRIFERSLPSNSSDVRKYDQKARQPVSEQLASVYLETILGTSVFRATYHYLAPKRNVSADTVGADCRNLRRYTDDVEGDALFVIDDVAIVVEVKGKSIADQSRRGDVRRLKNDLKATLGDGARQTVRIQELIETNHGIWENDTTWLDLSGIREVRSLVIVLDDIGPLGTNLGDLQQAGLLHENKPPLILSLHDLAVIAEIGERPSEFLLYLRRRTDSPVTKYYRAFDELDLYMLFLAADMYVEDDPEQVKAAHRTAPSATKGDRRRHRRSTVGTLVSDNCDDLTAWMNRAELPRNHMARKPTMNAPAKALELIDQLRSAGQPGWLRCGADLLALCGKAQSQVLSMVKTCAKATRRGSAYHDGMVACAGLWGFPTFFAATCPNDMPVADARERLQLYAQAKQYQLQADRAYGWVFDEHGSLKDFFYFNSVCQSDSALDQLVTRLNPVPTGRKYLQDSNSTPRKITKRAKKRKRK